MSLFPNVLFPKELSTNCLSHLFMKNTSWVIFYLSWWLFNFFASSWVLSYPSPPSICTHEHLKLIISYSKIFIDPHLKAVMLFLVSKLYHYLLSCLYHPGSLGVSISVTEFDWICPFLFLFTTSFLFLLPLPISGTTFPPPLSFRLIELIASRVSLGLWSQSSRTYVDCLNLFCHGTRALNNFWLLDYLRT